MRISSRLLRRLLIFAWTALFLAAAAEATPSKTEVVDTLYKADGTPAAGTLTIRWKAFTTISNDAVPAGELTVATDVNGNFSVWLIPNQGSRPTGGYYEVFIRLSDGKTSQEIWAVPTTSPTTVAAIRSTVVPQTAAVTQTTVADLQAEISSLARVASSGSYSDLLNLPTIPNLASPGPIGATAPATVNATGYTVNGAALATANLADGTTLATTSATNNFSQAQTITYTGGDSVAAALLVDTSSSTLSTNPAIKTLLPASGNQIAAQVINGSDTVPWYSLEYNLGGTGLSGVGLGVGGAKARDTFLYRAGAGQLATGKLAADVERNNSHWFDLRSVGVACNGATDDTAALAAAIGSFNHSRIEIPAGNCLINPGPATGTPALVIPTSVQSFHLEGRNGDQATLIQDEGLNSSSAPLLQIGDGTNVMAGTDISEVAFRGAAGVSYPNGVVSIWQNNLSSLHRITINGQAGANSTSLANKLTGSFALFQEMRFSDLAVYGPTGNGSTCVKLASPGGNTNFVNSNLESCQTGLNFTGSDGTPVLTWEGGHVERIPYTGSYGGIAFLIDQAQPYLHGLDWESGGIWLGASVAGGDLAVSSGARGWGAYYSDNGIGNRFHAAGTSSNHLGMMDLSGDEWYRVSGNVVADPLFTSSGTTGWTATNATVAVAAASAPGAKLGRSLVVTPSAAGGYIAQTFTVSSATDYLVSAVFLFTSLQPTAEVQVYDQTSNLLWDSGVISGSQGTPSGNDAKVYRVVRQLIPSGTATSFTVRVIGPVSAVPVQLLGLMIHPSQMSQSSVTVAGSAAASGSGTSWAVTIPGRNSGATSSAASWTIAVPSYNTAAFLRLHVADDASGVNPRCTIGGRIIDFQPGTSMDYVLPLALTPTTISCADYYAGTAANLVISQVSLLPIASSTLTPVTTPSDGRVVKAITPDGVQQRGTLAAANLSNGTTGTGSVVLATAPLLNSPLVLGNSSLPAAANAAGIYLAGGFASPITGKIYVGDGTGWRLSFAKRTASTDTEIASIADSGAINAVGGYQVNGTALAAAHLSNGTTGSGAVALATSPTLSGATVSSNPLTIATAGAASQAAVTISGTSYTGGTGTTTYPLFSIWPSGATAPTTWNTSGTLLGINAPSGFAGNFIDFHLNGGASFFKVDSIGTVNSYSANALALRANNGGVGGVAIGGINSATLAAGAAAGTSPTIACTSSHVCSYPNGTITLTTGTSPTTGALATVTTPLTHANYSDCMVSYVPTATATTATPVNLPCATNTTALTIYTGTTLAASTSYQITYHNLGY